MECNSLFALNDKCHFAKMMSTAVIWDQWQNCLTKSSDLEVICCTTSHNRIYLQQVRRTLVKSLFSKF